MDISKQSLFQMLRLLKFEEIELTHTYCRSSIHMSVEQGLSKDEIEEIMDDDNKGPALARTTSATARATMPPIIERSTVHSAS